MSDTEEQKLFNLVLVGQIAASLTGICGESLTTKSSFVFIISATAKTSDLQFHFFSCYVLSIQAFLVGGRKRGLEDVEKGEYAAKLWEICLL